MTGKAALRARAGKLLETFVAAGAVPVEADILLPAGPLLDLYGETIRARAFTSVDPGAGPGQDEMMLRPDFTVPVVEMHLRAGGGAARYAYAGEVFRRQTRGSDRPAETFQAGFERFGGDPVTADAEIFALFHGLLAPAGLAVATGDMGLLRAGVGALSLNAARRAALERHLWHPRRFRALVQRFRARQAVPAPAGDPASPEIGLRSRDEVSARLALLAEEAATPPLPGAEADALEALIGLKEDCAHALLRLRDIAVDLPPLAPAIDRFEARLAALSDLGIDAGRLPFEASYGRTSMEYYDGFVFGFFDPARPGAPAVATGGRYDALTRALGGPDASPAAGAVIRPDLLPEGGPWS